jgi:hypothetical protein
MSKFIDRLKQVSQPPTLSIGFRPKKVEPTRPKIQLVAFLHEDSQSLVSKLAAADAIVVRETKPFSDDTLWGIQMGKGALEEVDKAIETGADFAILPSSGTVLPSDRKIGKILQISASVTDVLLRTVNDLPVDAVLVTEDGEGNAITWQKLMLCKRFTGMLTKPVVVPIPHTVTGAELQLIWETGVNGVMVDMKSISDTSALDTLRQVIDGLQYPSPKKREKLTPVLPQTVAKTEQPEEPDEDDDDDD